MLRIFAVFLVLGNHLDLGKSSAGVQKSLLEVWQRGGWVGVDLFFVLSGFLVSSLLFQEHKRDGSINLKRFLIRRSFKIYPAFWFFLLVTVCVNSQRANGVSFRGLLGELLFLQNYLGMIWNHTWSLAVEEHFYFGVAGLFGAYACFKPKHSFSAIPMMSLLFCVICLILRMRNLAMFPEYDFFRELAPTHLRFDSLFFGVLISYLHHFRNFELKLSFVPTWLFFVAGFILLSPAFVFDRESCRWLPTFGVILLYVGSAAIMLGSLRFPTLVSPPFKLLGSLGAASYSIYLWHMPVNVWGWKLIQKITGSEGNFTTYVIAYFCGSCVIGFVMSRLVEFPMLRLRNFLFPSVAGGTNSG